VDVDGRKVADGVGNGDVGVRSRESRKRGVRRGDWRKQRCSVRVRK
jgi:hypothetical protein